MRLINRILESLAPKGARLGGPSWSMQCPAQSHDLVLRFLPTLFPSGAFACFEGTTEGTFAKWLEDHAVAPPLKVAAGTLWPKSDFYHVPLTRELLTEAAELVKRESITTPSIHLYVHDGTLVLLAWHDAFGTDPICVSKAVPSERIGEFFRAIDARNLTEWPDPAGDPTTP